MSNIRLSLCIPTNGIVEWVVPVLESIYTQNVDESLFEVIVCDNGTDSVLEENIGEFLKNHKNLVYKKSDAQMFLNQIACFRLANGNLLKFINHRNTLEPGSIESLLQFEEKNRVEKPVVYCTNGRLPLENETCYETFDSFVNNLAVFSSWSGGLCIWKDDFQAMPKDITYDKMFPHATILFYIRKNRSYVIKNDKILKELDNSHTKKGKYNLFQTFAVGFPALLKELLDSKDITEATYQNVTKNVKKLVWDFYVVFIIRKEPCSYDLSHYVKALSNIFSKKELAKFFAKGVNLRLKMHKDKLKSCAKKLLYSMVNAKNFLKK